MFVGAPAASARVKAHCKLKLLFPCGTTLGTVRRTTEVMSNADFSHAEAKLERGRKHVADVDAAITAFTGSDFYTLQLEPNAGTGRIDVVYRSLHEPSRQLNVMIGDAISNLRSALDYIAVALVSPITGNASGIGFPFADDSAGFEGQAKSDRCFGKCDQSIVDYIVNVQAYDGGKSRPLWVLNKLRNIDIHRLLLTTVNIAGVTVSGTFGGIKMTNPTAS
jgi:hypothetical protein